MSDYKDTKELMLLMKNTIKFSLGQKVLYYNKALITTKLETRWTSGYKISELGKKAHWIVDSDGRHFIVSEKYIKPDIT